MMRVPGSTSSLEKERAEGKDIRVVYSTLDAVRIAQENPGKKIIFLGIGFETTAPTIAAAILQAERLHLTNFFVLCSNKTMPAPMAAIAGAKRVQLDGFLCPGHVSAVIGSEPYEFLAAEYGKACVIAGFEPLDVLEAIDLLLNQIARKRPAVEIQYSRVVTREGNPAALRVMYQALEPCDADWRGIGLIPSSGLRIREQFSRFDAEASFSVAVEPTRAARGCICGEVMQGIARPPECPLFGSLCTPENPVGPCMVSSEGSCAAWRKYEHPFAEVDGL
jgi:hydrogenase expression/formation protein HypD